METIDPSLLTQPSLFAAVQVMYADGRQNTYTLRDDELITLRRVLDHVAEVKILHADGLEEVHQVNRAHLELLEHLQSTPSGRSADTSPSSSSPSTSQSSLLSPPSSAHTSPPRKRQRSLRTRSRSPSTRALSPPSCPFPIVPTNRNSLPLCATCREGDSPYFKKAHNGSLKELHRLVDIRSDPPGTTLQTECGVPDSKFDFDVRLVQLPRWELLGEVCRLAGGAILPYLPDGPTHAGWNHELGKLSLRLYLVSITGESSAREYKFHPVAILNWQPEGTLGRTEGDAECHPYIALAKNRGMVTVPMESKKPNVTPRDNRNAVKVRSFGRAKPPGTVALLSLLCYDNKPLALQEELLASLRVRPSVFADMVILETPPADSKNEETKKKMLKAKEDGADQSDNLSSENGNADSTGSGHAKLRDICDSLFDGAARSRKVVGAETEQRIDEVVPANEPTSEVNLDTAEQLSTTFQNLTLGNASDHNDFPGLAEPYKPSRLRRMWNRINRLSEERRLGIEQRHLAKQWSKTKPQRTRNDAHEQEDFSNLPEQNDGGARTSNQSGCELPRATAAQTPSPLPSLADGAEYDPEDYLDLRPQSPGQIPLSWSLASQGRHSISEEVRDDHGSESAVTYTAQAGAGQRVIMLDMPLLLTKEKKGKEKEKHHGKSKETGTTSSRDCKGPCAEDFGANMTENVSGSPGTRLFPFIA